MKITLMGETMCPSFELQPHSTVVVSVNPEGIFGVTFKNAGIYPGEKYRELVRVQPVWLEGVKLVSPHVQAPNFSGVVMLIPGNDYALVVLEKNRMHEYVFVPKETAVT